MLPAAIQSGIWTGSVCLLNPETIITRNPREPLTGLVYGFTATLVQDYLGNDWTAWMGGVLAGYIAANVVEPNQIGPVLLPLMWIKEFPGITAAFGILVILCSRKSEPTDPKTDSIVATSVGPAPEKI